MAGDLPPRAGLETIDVPVARSPNGTSITRPVLALLSNLPAVSKTASLEGGFAGLRDQRLANLESARALLTMQASDDERKVAIDPAEWSFANCESKTVSRRAGSHPPPPRGWISDGPALRAHIHGERSAGPGDWDRHARPGLITRHGSGAQNPVAGTVKHTVKMSPGLVGRGQKADADIPLPPEVRRLLLSRSNPRWGLRGLR